MVFVVQAYVIDSLWFTSVIIRCITSIHTVPLELLLAAFVPFWKAPITGRLIWREAWREKKPHGHFILTLLICQSKSQLTWTLANQHCGGVNTSSSSRKCVKSTNHRPSYLTRRCSAISFQHYLSVNQFPWFCDYFPTLDFMGFGFHISRSAHVVLFLNNNYLNFTMIGSFPAAIHLDLYVYIFLYIPWSVFSIYKHRTEVSQRPDGSLRSTRVKSEYNYFLSNFPLEVIISRACNHKV